MRVTHGDSCRKRWADEYRIWLGMTQRCIQPKRKDYPKYGGSGITICERWMKYENFLEDMGRRPSKDHSLERIDNSLGYFPENCKWATRFEQTRNRSSNRWLELNGVRMVITDWARSKGIHPGTLRHRLRLGWTLERALTEKPGKSRKAAL